MSKAENPLNVFHTNYRNYSCCYDNAGNENYLSYEDFFNNTWCCDNADIEKILSDTEFADNVDSLQCNSKKCIKQILCSQALVSKCEAKLFCHATSRLSYELLYAHNLCEVRQIIDNIGCLFTTSAMKEFALADILKSYALIYNQHICPKCCKKD